MNEFSDWFQKAHLLGTPLTSVALAVVASLACYLFMSGGLRLALGRMQTIATRTSNRVDDIVVAVLSGTSQLLMLLAALLVGIGMLDLNARWNARVGQLWFIAVALQFGLWLTRAISI